MAGRFADFGGLRQPESGFLRRTEDGAGERVLRVALETRDEREHVARHEPGGDELFGELWVAVGKRSGLVEDRGSAVGDLLEHDRVLDDDRPPGAERDRADDSDRDGEKQRT